MKMRNNLKKKLVFLLAFMLLFSLPLMGCGNKEDVDTAGDTAAEMTGWTYVENKGELIVGLDDTFAPMGFRDESGTLVGFDVDMATAVGELLGVNIKFQPIDWDSKELELESKNIDCIWNGMSVTPERMEKMALTNIYLVNSNIVMTLSDKVKIATEDDLAKYKIGSQAGSSAMEVMQASEKWASYGPNVSEYRSFDDAILDMKAGRVDCVVIDKVLGEYKNSKMDPKMYTCDFHFGDDFFAVGCRKADPDLADKLNEAFGTLIENGKAGEISVKWFGEDVVVQKPYNE